MSYRASKQNFLPPPSKHAILKDPNTRQDTQQRHWIIQTRPQPQTLSWGIFDSAQWSNQHRIGYCVYHDQPPQTNEKITIENQMYLVENVYQTKKKSWTIILKTTI